MGVLSATTVKPVKLVIPPLEEQKLIGDSVSSIDNVIFDKQSNLNSLLHMKKALMQDLLTGKVRVQVDASEASEA